MNRPSVVSPVAGSRPLARLLMAILLHVRREAVCLPPPDPKAAVAFATTTSSPDPLPRQPPHAHPSSSPQRPRRRHASGRRWKSRRRWETFLPPPSRDLSPTEEDALRRQLSYLPPNASRVSARSGSGGGAGGGGEGARPPSPNADGPGGAIDTSPTAAGRPVAIQSYPLLVHLEHDDDGSSSSSGSGVRTPFPTLYWLTCPHVSRAVSELEREGRVREFQLRLEGDAGLARAWRACHDEYAAERWGALSEGDRRWLLSSCRAEEEGGPSEGRQGGRRRMMEMLRWSGVAGIDHRGTREGGNAASSQSGDDGDGEFIPSVKCLHSHYAHYRSQLSRWSGEGGAGADGGAGKEPAFNVVGRWTHELLLERFPEVVL